MSHVHHHRNTWGTRLIITMMMNLVIPIVQIIGGVLAGSVALISDAVHNLGDFTATLVSYVALSIGEKPATARLTFGYKRIEVLAAVVNVALLTVACVYIAYEGWRRFTNPQPIQGELVTLFALVGFIANMIAVLLLHKGAKVNLNLKSVFLHMLTDALTSVGVAVVGIIWIFAPLYWLDPVVSWIIVAMILYGAWDILKNAIAILMDATPPGLDIVAIQHAMLGIGGIDDVHHIHVWNTSPDRIALAAHIVVPDQMLSDVDRLATAVREMLYSRFHIDHPILQFETRRDEELQIL